jgi:hypothetical protein
VTAPGHVRPTWAYGTDRTEHLARRAGGRRHGPPVPDAALQAGLLNHPTDVTVDPDIYVTDWATRVRSPPNSQRGLPSVLMPGRFSCP